MRRHPRIRTYRNPVHPGYMADPFVLRVGATYLAYGTQIPARAGRVFQVLASDDLVRWTALDGALERIDLPGAVDYWAPEVAPGDDGLFYLYFSSGLGDRFHRLRVAVAERPEGPFRDTGRVLTPDDEPFTIDAHPFRDADGARYLYYARDLLDGPRPGTSLAVDRMIDMVTLAREPRTVLRASADWQLFQRERPMYGATRDWYTLEGPFVVRHDDRLYCLYSGGSWETETYGVSWAVAASPLGPFTDAGGGTPALLRSVPGHVVGPGHCSVTTGPDGRSYLVYHAWDAGRTVRRMCIDRLDWTADGPRTAGPTWASRPAPNAGG